MWMIGMVPNELPFVVFAYLAAATLVGSVQHDLANAVGIIGFALAVLSTLTLVVIVWRAAHTRSVVASAMRDALGIEVPRSRLALLHILLAPLVVTRRDVIRTANIPYGEGVELPGAQLSFGLFRSIRFERLIDGIEVFATWVVDHRTADA